MIIGICGYARSGKDTLCSLLRKTSPYFRRYAFADALKRDLEPFIRDKFGWDIFDLTDKQKVIVRPILIAYGCAQREAGNGLHWVYHLDLEIASDGLADTFIPVITDFRFINEVNYFKNKYGKDFILAEVIRDDIPTPPTEEQINHPKLSAVADIKIHWPTIKTNVTELMPYVTSGFGPLLNESIK